MQLLRQRPRISWIDSTMRSCNCRCFSMLHLAFLVWLWLFLRKNEIWLLVLWLKLFLLSSWLMNFKMKAAKRKKLFVSNNAAIAKNYLMNWFCKSEIWLTKKLFVRRYEENFQSACKVGNSMINKIHNYFQRKGLPSKCCSCFLAGMVQDLVKNWWIKNKKMKTRTTVNNK